MPISTKKSADALVGASRLMLEGIQKRLDILSKVGITEETVATLKANYETFTADDAKQEELKSALKTQTEKTVASQDVLFKQLSELRKLVKIAVSKSDWNTFGIDDKQ